MVDQLKDLLFLIKQVDFEAPNFEELYQTDAEYFSETVYRDIKHLEQQHYDLIYTSSLRFLSNVLECLQFNFEIDIYEFDIRSWAQQGLDHILKFSGLRRSFRQPISCCQRYCKCISNLFKSNRQRK
ncbi:unnamed protein product [Paramecium sonneborni]|uniref:Uncharacterized protein n=1 Tax=Paramecium sonneborni TaxID=65129 RepID=A0A8S1LB36_9CILI|nr:unnamed protein product [Paramecium sonneborni]